MINVEIDVKISDDSSSLVVPLKFSNLNEPKAVETALASAQAVVNAIHAVSAIVQPTAPGSAPGFNPNATSQA